MVKIYVDVIIFTRNDDGREIVYVRYVAINVGKTVSLFLLILFFFLLSFLLSFIPSFIVRTLVKLSLSIDCPVSCIDNSHYSRSSQCREEEHMDSGS